MKFNFGLKDLISIFTLLSMLVAAIVYNTNVANSSSQALANTQKLEMRYSELDAKLDKKTEEWNKLHTETIDRLSRIEGKLDRYSH